MTFAGEGQLHFSNLNTLGPQNLSDFGVHIFDAVKTSLWISMEVNDFQLVAEFFDYLISNFFLIQARPDRFYGTF